MAAGTYKCPTPLKKASCVFTQDIHSVASLLTQCDTTVTKLVFAALQQHEKAGCLLTLIAY